MTVIRRDQVPEGTKMVKATNESQDWLGILRQNPAYKKALAKRHAVFRKAEAKRERERKEAEK